MQFNYCVSFCYPILHFLTFILHNPARNFKPFIVEQQSCHNYNPVSTIEIGLVKEFI